MANIFEFLSKDGNITPEKARKSRQMPFHDKTAYVWMGMLPLKKRVNRDKCSFATKQRMFGVFAIDEILRYRGSRIPGSPTLCHPAPQCVYQKPSSRKTYHWSYVSLLSLAAKSHLTFPSLWSFELSVTTWICKPFLLESFSRCFFVYYVVLPMRRRRIILAYGVYISFVVTILVPHHLLASFLLVQLAAVMILTSLSLIPRCVWTYLKNYLLYLRGHWLRHCQTLLSLQTFFNKTNTKALTLLTISRKFQALNCKVS